MRCQVLVLLCVLAVHIRGAQTESTKDFKIPVILDTDLGNDIDDAFALALVLASPELDLRGVTTVSGDTQIRAMMVCRFLTAAGRREIPVAKGHPPQPAREMGGQYQYYYHPGVLYNRTSKPVKESAVEFLYNQLKAEPGKLTLLATGPLSNIARLLTEHPECKPWIHRIVLMGGAVRVGYDGRGPAAAEFNLASDIQAAQIVFSSGVPLVVAPLDATSMVKLDDTLCQKLFNAGTMLTLQVQTLHQLWNQTTPTLYDPIAVALCFEEKFCAMEDLRLEVDQAGLTRIANGTPNARVATSVRAPEFLNWYVNRVASAGQRALAKAPGNVTAPVPRRGLPKRVHTFEDFETNIEKRWWMSGKLETNNVPPGSTRAFRGVLTQDFDDLMGDPTTMYTAVIFNPVPGPPMGKNSRLSFRYWLKGTDNLRVQIYSLSKGYHRYLSLTKLPQGRWEAATVDMTSVRRPDGSGGPLAEDERIDDIQFYVDPRAELLIDDIVLYDEAISTETHPFPRRMIFTGWFDTGKQGAEWPGEFEIVPHQPPLTWKAAKSVVNKQTGESWLRVSLRGHRRVNARTNVRFHYRLSRGSNIAITMANPQNGESFSTTLKTPVISEWAEAEVQIYLPAESVRGITEADEVHFTTQKDAELLIDDLLIYEPASER